MTDEKQTGLLDFEAALADLESIVDKLEQGQLTLDESLKLYKQGEMLSQRCKDLLDKAESQIGIQTENND